MPGNCRLRRQNVRSVYSRFDHLSNVRSSRYHQSGFFRRWTWRFHDHFCQRMSFTIEWTVIEPLHGCLVNLFIANRFVPGSETKFQTFFFLVLILVCMRIALALCFHYNTGCISISIKTIAPIFFKSWNDSNAIIGTNIFHWSWHFYSLLI